VIIRATSWPKQIIIVILIIGVLILGMIYYSRFRTEKRQEREIEEYIQRMLNISAEEVIEQHFKWKNDQNIRGLSLTMHKGGFHPNYFRNLRSITLISISDISDSDVAIGLQENASWFPSNYYDLKFFSVVFDLQRRNQHRINDGTNYFIYVVIKETPESPWEIYHWVLD